MRGFRTSPRVFVESACVGETDAGKEADRQEVFSSNLYPGLCRFDFDPISGRR